MMSFKIVLSLFVAQPALSAWSPSYESSKSCGNLGGSEILHLKAHDEKVFAANGFWEDSCNQYYPSYSFTDPHGAYAWGQVLRLDSASGSWEVDLQLSQGYLRTEALEQLTFTTDKDGNTLSPPVTRLVAAAYQAGNTKRGTVFIRNDDTGAWSSTNVVQGSSDDIASIRSLQVHKDSETGIDHAFITIGTMGIYRGSWDAAAKTIVWQTSSETGILAGRSLGQTVANGALYFSVADKLYARRDGSATGGSRWNEVAISLPAADSKGVNLAVGGIRGLTTVEGPSAHGDSILLVFNPDGSSQACVHRLDPDGSGGFTTHDEMCLAQLASEYLGVTVEYSIGGYNDFMPLQDPSSGNEVHIVGFEGRIQCNMGVACTQEDSAWAGEGFYPGAIFFVRKGPDDYELNEVNGRYTSGDADLVAPRTYVVSPFAGDDAVYIGGYDANQVTTSNTAWVYRGDTATVLQALHGGDGSDAPPPDDSTPSPTTDTNVDDGTSSPTTDTNADDSTTSPTTDTDADDGKGDDGKDDDGKDDDGTVTPSPTTDSAPPTDADEESNDPLSSALALVSLSPVGLAAVTAALWV